jgi:hypothetical protein
LGKHRKTDLDMARDELMSHVHRCNVLQATPEQQAEWLEDTIEYMAERFPTLAREELGELRMIGTRFCQPVIPHGKGNSALTVEEHQETTEEMVGAA